MFSYLIFNNFFVNIIEVKAAIFKSKLFRIQVKHHGKFLKVIQVHYLNCTSI